jgi:hypothetical protein
MKRLAFAAETRMTAATRRRPRETLENMANSPAWPEERKVQENGRRSGCSGGADHTIPVKAV